MTQHPTPPTGDPSAAAARQRLDRLDLYLREDPANQSLLADAFETALACGEWERALFHLRHGQALQTDALAWRLREGDFWLAQRRYDEAQQVLEPLLRTPHPPAGFVDVLLHNLAFIDFRRGRYKDCVARLAPVVEPLALGPASLDARGAVATLALQQLWLRALHHDGQLERAMAWGLEAEQRRRLDAMAAGVASLVAIDASDFEAARRWSVASMANLAGSVEESGVAALPVEALIARASLALGACDAARARQLVDAALQRQPGDGRAWSVRGFVDMLDSDLSAAARSFEKALAGMPDHIGTWHGKAWTLLLQGDLAGARASFETALALDRNFAESHGGLAVVLAMQQLRQAAQDHAALALRLDKRSLSGRYAEALLAGEAMKNADDLQRLITQFQSRP